MLNCAAFGGYPPPSLELYIGSRDVTGEFEYSNVVRRLGESVGLRQLVYRTDRRSGEFMPTATDDEQKLKCIATVAGLKPYAIFVQLAVDCKLYRVHLFILLSTNLCTVFEEINYCLSRFDLVYYELHEFSTDIIICN